MKKIIKISILLIILSLSFNRPNFAFSGYEEEINQEIKNLNNKISGSKKKIEDIQNQQQEYNELIAQKRNEQGSLSNELEIINAQAAKAQLEIEASELEIDKTNLEIKKTTLDIQDKDDQINKEKEHIATMLRLMYKQDQVSTLEILLLNNSLAEFVNQLQYLENTNEEVADSIAGLKDIKSKLEENQRILAAKEEELTNLKKNLEEEKLVFTQQQEDKNFLLEETKQSEKKYQYLLAAAKKEQERTSAEIYNLEKSVREKLEKLKDNPELNYTGLVWPTGKSYITATFHDPEYPFRRSLGEHSGIDIRATQGTTIKAAANGYVARVKFDGSKNYAYIMIIHGDGLSTVYGHVSGVNVKADDYVVQGQVIGRTGGLPGSPGSGPFCTGAHLHLEVRKNGIPVNPLEYLP
ncbi:MAG: peptidoglycan DD-metalloendopeptidase family protein [Patescibacteria group bacterium]